MTQSIEERFGKIIKPLYLEAEASFAENLHVSLLAFIKQVVEEERKNLIGKELKMAQRTLEGKVIAETIQAERQRLIKEVEKMENSRYDCDYGDHIDKFDVLHLLKGE